MRLVWLEEDPNWSVPLRDDMEKRDRFTEAGEKKKEKNNNLQVSFEREREGERERERERERNRIRKFSFTRIVV